MVYLAIALSDWIC